MCVAQNQTSKFIQSLHVGTFNCKGANHISAREKIVHMMIQHKLDILSLQGTHINTNTEERHRNYFFNFSTSITDKQREDANKIREQTTQGKGRGKQKGTSPLDLYNLDSEKLGTAVVYTEAINHAKLDVFQHDNRNITLSLRGRGTRLNITGTHAPQSGRPTQEKEKSIAISQKSLKSLGGMTSVSL